jgi:hypothetical protein
VCVSVSLFSVLLTAANEDLIRRPALLGSLVLVQWLRKLFGFGYRICLLARQKVISCAYGGDTTSSVDNGAATATLGCFGCVSANMLYRRDISSTARSDIAVIVRKFVVTYARQLLRRPEKSRGEHDEYEDA